MNEYYQGRQTDPLSHQGKLPKYAKRCQGLHQSKHNYLLACHSATLLKAANARGRDCGEKIRNRKRDIRPVTRHASGRDSDTVLLNQQCSQGLLEKNTSAAEVGGGPVCWSLPVLLGRTAGYHRSGSPAPNPGALQPPTTGPPPTQPSNCPWLPSHGPPGPGPGSPPGDSRLSRSGTPPRPPIPPRRPRRAGGR